jgi:hypothetical protein
MKIVLNLHSGNEKIQRTASATLLAIEDIVKNGNLSEQDLRQFKKAVHDTVDHCANPQGLLYELSDTDTLNMLREEGLIS